MITEAYLFDFLLLSVFAGGFFLIIRVLLSSFCRPDHSPCVIYRLYRIILLLFAASPGLALILPSCCRLHELCIGLLCPAALPITGVYLSITGCFLCLFFFQLIKYRSLRLSGGLCPDASQRLLQEMCREVGIRRPVQLRESYRVCAVVSGGILHPVILLPRQKRSAQDYLSLRPVLLHELLHIRHHDILRQYIFHALLCIHWFNPCFWLLWHESRRWREYHCDYLTICITREPEQYIARLLCLTGELPTGAARGGRSALRFLQNRIHRIRKAWLC